MFQLHSPTQAFLCSGLALLFLQLTLFVWALPPFQAGIWLQTEPLAFGLFVLAALTGLWLAWGMAGRHIALPARLHPLWLCQLAYLAWQIPVTLLATSPWRSWFGPPQIADGAALSLTLLLMTVQAYLLWQSVPFRRPIVAVAGIALAIQTLLHAVYYGVPDYVFVPDRWAPAQWPEYLPFMAAYVWLAIHGGTLISRRIWHLGLILGVALVLFVSWNKSAMVLFTPVLLISLLFAVAPLPPAFLRAIAPGRKWRMALMAMCVLPMLIVPLSAAVPALEKEDANGLSRLLTARDNGIGARLALNQVALSTLEHEPSRLLTGAGWGRFSDDLFRYALVDGIHVFHNGERHPNWFLLDGSTYHSHSEPLEALLSLGLPGMALWYALPLMLLWYMPSRLFWSCAPMLVAFAALSHLWMQLPQCIPYQALALAVLLAECIQPASPAPQRKPYAPGLLAIALVMAASACAQWQAMRYGEQLQKALRSGNTEGFSEEWLAQDFRRGGDRWWASASYYANQASRQAANHQADGHTLIWYSYFLHTARDASVNPRIGPRASSMELKLQYYLFGGMDDPLFSSLRQEAAHEFESAVMRITQKAPLRDDLTAFFLLNLAEFTHHDIEREKDILTRMLLISPEHRGALWMLGFILSKTEGHENEGLDMMRKAARLHVETVFPVTERDLAPFLKENP